MKYLLALLLAFPLFAGTYDYDYEIKSKETSSKTTLDAFMYGEFKEIVRFDMLSFEDKQLNEDNKTHYDTIVKTIKDYKEKGEDIHVKIIGHTNEPTDNHNEIVSDSKTYADSVIKWFSYSLDSNKSKTISRDYAKNIQDKFVKDGINEEITVLEYRAGNDKAFSDGTCKGRELSNRVMVTIYVSFPNDIDSDKDGVFDSKDKCPGTPRGSAVDSFGCPIDSDKDGVIDYKDACPKTPLGVKVDKKGCPLDSDGDGVVDYKDLCPNTPKGVTIDPNGCALSKTLALTFKTASDKILQISHSKVVEFATFMQKNPAYNAKIIGHTDSIGKAETNMILSQKRAKATKAALVAQGVEASRIMTKGRGELDPITSNRTKEGRSANRRIEVKLSFDK